MIINWTPLADIVETHDRFLITTHVRPDGDALGSEVGMAGLLRQKGKDVRVVNASPTPPRYDFLDPDRTFFEHYGHPIQASDLDDREVAIILDLSAWGQLGEMAEFIRGFRGVRVVIDHHVSQDDMGATFFKDSTAEATGTLVQSAVAALGGSLTKDVATGLLTAIAMDTGWFRHPSTRPSTMRGVADLMEAGADVAGIYRKLFEQNTQGRLRLMGRTLSGLKTDLGGRVAWANISQDDLRETGAIPPDSEDLIDFTVSLRGVEVGLLLIEQARGGVKVSFRSRNGLDCSRLASTLGGGGHKAAAGATVGGTMAEVEARALAAVRQALDSATVPSQT
ncbi:DHH family phosphoesterase [Aquisphaera giovannonii]|nr:DHH family phosphoesterase [Aquisphaera giovannonii]